MAAKPNMARQLVFIDGSDNEIMQEVAEYMKIGDEVKPMIEKGQLDEALTEIVKSSSALNSVPEKEFGPAYNLLIYMILNFSKEPKKHLPIVCQNFSKPITSSPVNGRDLALGTLSTIFNLLGKNDPLRYNVFMQILKFVKQHSMFDSIKPGLKNIPGWMEAWDLDAEDKRSLYVSIADAAEAADEKKIAYEHLLQALRTFDPQDNEDLQDDEAKQLSLRAFKMVLVIDKPWAYDFQGLRVLPAVQALNETHPVYAELLNIFAEQDLEDFNDFNEEHEGFLDKEKLNFKILQTKIRLLTFASIAAAHTDREIPYALIAKGLQVPTEDVELWTIDVIRAQLVEGRMSQRDKVFRVHKTIYRVFSEKQWVELQSRIDGWKTTMAQVLGVIRQSQIEAETAKERQQAEIERKLAQAGLNDAPSYGRRGGRQGGQQPHRIDNAAD